MLNVECGMLNCAPMAHVELFNEECGVWNCAPMAHVELFNEELRMSTLNIQHCGPAATTQHSTFHTQHSTLRPCRNHSTFNIPHSTFKCKTLPTTVTTRYCLSPWK